MSQLDRLRPMMSVVLGFRRSRWICPRLDVA